jgi:hypothetical protein
MTMHKLFQTAVAVVFLVATFFSGVALAKDRMGFFPVDSNSYIGPGGRVYVKGADSPSRKSEAILEVNSNVSAVFFSDPRVQSAVNLDYDSSGGIPFSRLRLTFEAGRSIKIEVVSDGDWDPEVFYSKNLVDLLYMNGIGPVNKDRNTFYFYWAGAPKSCTDEEGVLDFAFRIGSEKGGKELWNAFWQNVHLLSMAHDGGPYCK